MSLVPGFVDSFAEAYQTRQYDNELTKAQTDADRYVEALDEIRQYASLPLPGDVRILMVWDVLHALEVG